MSRDNPKWQQLYLVLRPTLRGAASIPAGEAFTAVHGSTTWNFATAHQWKRDMNRHLQRDYSLTSTTEVAYRLDDPDQPLPTGISPWSIEGRIFKVLADAAGDPVRRDLLINRVWADDLDGGSWNGLYVGVSHLKTAGANVVSTGCILLRPYYECAADFEHVVSTATEQTAVNADAPRPISLPRLSCQSFPLST